MNSTSFTSTGEHIKGISDRKKSEKWAQRLIKEARENPVPGKEDVALYAFAEATDLEGELLPVEVAAVELLNIIRSEERRVGKECTSQKARGHWNKSPKGICTAAQTCCNE